MRTAAPVCELKVESRRIAPWVVAGASIVLALPGTALSTLSGLLDLAFDPSDGLHESLDACGMPQNWFWEAYQNHTGWFELALALVLGVIAATVIFAAWHRHLIATLLLGALLVALSVWPFIVYYERSGDGAWMLIECHDL
ncbi:hypothetical protein [Pimelobacter simplex]|uniref:hypothetical protein n=1 Tax=Nocardioides simplex TaxID=2045 RepID=UPI0019312072|nr:hypothetical protein [Pimelobacter simplex]